jgi:hypothetical protein
VKMLRLSLMLSWSIGLISTLDILPDCITSDIRVIVRFGWGAGVDHGNVSTIECGNSH